MSYSSNLLIRGSRATACGSLNGSNRTIHFRIARVEGIAMTRASSGCWLLRHGQVIPLRSRYPVEARTPTERPQSARFCAESGCVARINSGWRWTFRPRIASLVAASRCQHAKQCQAPLLQYHRHMVGRSYFQYSSGLRADSHAAPIHSHAWLRPASTHPRFPAPILGGRQNSPCPGSAAGNVVARSTRAPPGRAGARLLRSWDRWYQLRKAGLPILPGRTCRWGNGKTASRAPAMVDFSGGQRLSQPAPADWAFSRRRLCMPVWRVRARNQP